mgnify:CR=1 FL=1
MTSSVRSRLWLSYVGVIVFVLAVILAGILLSIVRNPIVRQSSNIRLLVVTQSTVNRIERLLRTDPGQLNETLIREARVRNIRIFLLDENGALTLDTGQGIQPAVNLNIDDERYWDGDTFILTDSSGGLWSAVIRPLSSGEFAAVLLDQPRYPLANFFRNDVLAPTLFAGLIGLVLALLITLGFSQWITRPLRDMAFAARASRGENPVRMKVAGPKEVQDVAAAYNALLDRVESAQRSQRDFLADISHELKTPLTSIQGFAQAIKDNALEGNVAISSAGGVIFDEATRMYRLVMQLMALARLESGVTAMDFQPIDLVGILENLLSRQALQVKEKQIQIKREFNPLPFIEADGDQMNQLFGNLLENAIKFSPAGGTIVLNLSSADRLVTVRILDDGPGIPPQDLTRIFDRFYQVDPSRRGDQKRGIGLGLAIASQIVRAHQGMIWAENRDGGGAAFLVSLPLCQKDVITQQLKAKP